jgi:hypothetical protein
MGSRPMTNDEHMDRLVRYLQLLLAGGNHEKRSLKRKREIDEKFAQLFEMQRRRKEERRSHEHEENSKEPSLNIKSKVHDIAFLHDVVFSF